jgi:hypothetical protein
MEKQIFVLNFRKTSSPMLRPALNNTILSAGKMPINSADAHIHNNRRHAV